MTSYFLKNYEYIAQDGAMKSVVTIRGHNLLERMAAEYYVKGEHVTVTKKWNCKVKEKFCIESFEVSLEF